MDFSPTTIRGWLTDCCCLPADLVYGIPLSFTGQILVPVEQSTLDLTTYVHWLYKYMQDLPPMWTRKQTINISHSRRHGFLSSCVLVKRHCKNPSYPLDIHDKQETVSIDRLKRAFTDRDTKLPHPPPVQWPQTPWRTQTSTPFTYVTISHSEHHVHWPTKLSKTIYTLSGYLPIFHYLFSFHIVACQILYLFYACFQYFYIVTYTEACTHLRSLALRTHVHTPLMYHIILIHLFFQAPCALCRTGFASVRP